ncbi:MAG: hypothetical protein ABIH37_04350 [archaeon]
MKDEMDVIDMDLPDMRNPQGRLELELRRARCFLSSGVNSRAQLGELADSFYHICATFIESRFPSLYERFTSFGLLRYRTF